MTLLDQGAELPKARSDAGLRELIAIREISQAFLTADNPADVYQFALSRVTALVGATFACVYLVQPDSDHMALAAAHNWPERYDRFLGEMRVRLGTGPSGQAAAERRVIEIRDIFSNDDLADWREVATELGFSSLVALPLQTAAGVLGTVTFYFASPNPITVESGGLLRVVADQMAATAEKARMIMDLQRANTELQSANAELEKQYTALLEARRLQDEFLGNMSHELRTPLTAVLGYLALMEEGLAGPVTPEQQETLGQVKVASEKLLSMIGDLLDLTSLKRGEVKLTITDFNPRDPLHDAVAAIGERSDAVSLVIEDAPAMPVMSSDKAKLTRLLTALMSNAFKFTTKGEVRVAVQRKGERIVYRVSDTGIGVSPDAQEFIFDEFRQEDGSATRRYGGSGLGLAIARRLAHMLGGEVRMSSERGKGSTFTVELPTVIRANASL